MSVVPEYNQDGVFAKKKNEKVPSFMVDQK